MCSSDLFGAGRFLLACIIQYTRSVSIAAVTELLLSCVAHKQETTQIGYKNRCFSAADLLRESPFGVPL